MRDDREDIAVGMAGVYVAGAVGAICAMSFCWNTLQQAGLVVPALFGSCALVAAAPWIYMSYEYSR